MNNLLPDVAYIDTQEVKSGYMDFHLDINTGFIDGMVTGKERLTQQLYLALMTPKKAYSIYSKDYGTDFLSLIGKSYEYIVGNFRFMVEECIKDFSEIIEIVEITTKKGDNNDVIFTITLLSVFGDISISSSIALS